MRLAPLAFALALLGAARCFPDVPLDTPGGPSGAEPLKVVSEASTVPELFANDPLRAYEFRQGDRLVGRSWGRFEGPVQEGKRTLYRIAVRIELLPEGSEPLRSVSEVLVDEKGRLISGFERSAAAELRYEVKKKVLHMSAHTGMPTTQTDELVFDEGAAFMGYMATIHEEIMLATRRLVEGKNTWRLISLSTGRADEWTGSVRGDGGNLIEIETNLGESIELRGGRIARVDVKEDQLVVRSVVAEWPTWEVAAPKVLKYQKRSDARFEIVKVELPGRTDEPALAGEVLRPKNPLTDPVPAVLFLGAGPATRHGFAGPPAVDLGSHQITDALADAGFMVLRYDERGVGESAPAEFSWDGQLEDARRAFRTLIVQDGVDPDRIVVIGHGEGGWRALQMALERPQSVIGVALLGSEGRTFAERFADQPQVLRSLETGIGLPSGLVDQARWYKEILSFDPAQTIGRLSVPLYFAQGGKDFEVDPDVALKSLTNAARKHRKIYKVARYPGLDHLFKPVPGKSGPQDYLLDRDVDRKFIEDLVAWARARAG